MKNKMIKSAIGFGLGLSMVASFAAPALASSTISNIKFDNGQTQTSCTAGSSVNVTFRVVVPAGEVAEVGQTDILGDNLAPSLPIDLGGSLGLQEGAHDVNATLVCPENTGYYTVEFRTAGIFGGQESVVITDGVTSVGTFNNAIRVVAEGTSTSGSSLIPAWFTAWWNANKPATTPAPTTSAACTAIATKMVGTQMNTYNDANVKLQGFLLSEGASIPALKAGASFGFYGPQTMAAVSWFNTVNNCK